MISGIVIVYNPSFIVCAPPTLRTVSVICQVCNALAQIAKHSVDLAEVVVEAEIFPNILNCLKDNDSAVRKNAATCIREVCTRLGAL